jgi:hypothetical protein
MAQVRFRPGVPEASVDDEGGPEEQPDHEGRCSSIPTHLLSCHPGPWLDCQQVVLAHQPRHTLVVRHLERWPILCDRLMGYPLQLNIGILLQSTTKRPVVLNPLICKCAPIDRVCDRAQDRLAWSAGDGQA